MVHLDETGWGRNGCNGYIWTATAADWRLYRHGTRKKEMVDRVIGANYAGVVVGA